MNVSHNAAIPQKKIGTCPHGLPSGACPICAGMGGGGGGGKSTKKARPAGEMTYDQCYAIWQQMLKAKELAAQRKQDALQAQQASVSFSQKLNNLAIKMANLVDKLNNFVQNTQNLPKIIAKPLALAAKIIIPILNALKTIPLIAQKAVDFIQQKFVDITDKLNAIFGELKNSIEKKISDKLKDFKKKFKSLFGLLETAEVEENNEKKIEESKRMFELKNILHSIKEKLFKDKDINK